MKQKKWKFWVVTAATIFLFILIAGVDGLTFQPPQPSQPPSAGGGSRFVAPESLIRLALFFLAGLILLIIIYIPAAVWRHYKTAVFMIALLLLAGVGVMRLAAPKEVGFPEPEMTSERPEDAEMEEEEPYAPPEFEVDLPPETTRPVWLIWLSTIIIGALIVWATAVAFNYIWRRTDPESVLSSLAQEAEAALADIRAGGEALDAIIRCYLEMARILSEQHEIERETGATPREFERRLIELGLPAPPVASLTRLFEAARYGRHAANAEEQAEAVAALEAIIAAGREL